MNKINIKTYGKFILTGEHSVLRGYPALVFPLKEICFNFNFENSDKPLNFIYDDRDDLFKSLKLCLEKGAVLLKKSLYDLNGNIEIHNSIPIGKGLGASAALCVAVGKFFIELDWLKSENLFYFSKSLENLFHGESSGVDIAVNVYNKPLIFCKPNTFTPFDLNFNPHLYLSYSGEKGLTSLCVNQVKNIFDQDPILAETIDKNMHESYLLALRAIEEKNIKILAESFDLAKICFEKWKLISPLLSSHLEYVKSIGAIGVKPTGSGFGGYVLSLWENEPPKEFLSTAIKAL